MKFTSEDLMKAMGLQVGDNIKVGYFIYKVVVKDEEINERNIALEREDGNFLYIKQLLDQEFEILPKPKRVGDLKCNLECDNCPLIAVCAMYDTFEELTLYEILERNNSMASDQEIYDLLKARLDKVVEE